MTTRTIDEANITDGQIAAVRQDVVPIVLAHPLSVTCPVCEAQPNTICASMAKRWQSARSLTVGVLDNGWRKTPHRERVEASRAENERRQHDWRARCAAAYNARFKIDEVIQPQEPPCRTNT